MVVSGGYDNLIKMYDTRTNQVTLMLDHGSPVESLLFLPSGSLFLSAGGTAIKIWDTIAGGKLLGCISQHHKTITCLRLASDNKRLLSGSLDRHVKIYDVNTFQVVHTLDFPNSVLSLGVSKNDDTLVAGLVDGLVSVHRREEDTKPVSKQKKVPFAYTQNIQYNRCVCIIVSFRLIRINVISVLMLLLKKILLKRKHGMMYFLENFNILKHSIGFYENILRTLILKEQ